MDACLAKKDDTCRLEENVPGSLRRMCYVYRVIFKVIFKGRAASVDSIVHNAEGFVAWWFRRA